MSTVVEQPVVAPIPETGPSIEDRVGALQGEARYHWDLTGDIDAAEAKIPKISDDPAAPSPASETPVQTGAVETVPDSEPGDNLPDTPRGRKDWATVRRNLARAEAERDLLKSQLAESRQSAPATREQPKPDNRPAPAAVPLKRPEFPKFSKHATEAEIDAATEKWAAEDEAYINGRVTAALEARFGQEKQTQAAEIADKTWAEKITSGKTKYPDFEAVAFSRDTPFFVGINHVVQGRPDAEDVLYHIGKNPAVAKKLYEATNIPGYTSIEQLTEAARKDPRVAMQWGESIGRAKIEFDAIAKSLGKPSPASPQRTLPKPTGAVAVIPNAAAVGDPIAAAVANDDFATFEKLANQEAITRKRGR